jgi:hypothetical protein
MLLQTLLKTWLSLDGVSLVVLMGLPFLFLFLLSEVLLLPSYTMLPRHLAVTPGWWRGASKLNCCCWCCCTVR